MPKLQIKKATTSQILYVFVQDSSVATGAGKTGLAFNTASLVAYYVLPQAAAVAITLATQTVTAAWSSGGFVEVDATNMPGIYRFDIPNAALATGNNASVVVLKGASNMAPVVLEIQLVSYDPNDAVRMGVTALPNAAAEAAGGLFTRGAGAGQLLQNANGQIDVNVRRWRDTDVTHATTAGHPDVVVVTNTDKTGYGLSSAAVQAIWDALTSALTTANSIGKRIVDYLTGDIFARLGAPAGASTAADIAAVSTKLGTPAVSIAADLVVIDDLLDTEVAAIYNRLGAPAGASMAADVAAVKTETASIYARQGAPAGASQSADVAAVKVDTAAVKLKTDGLNFNGTALQVDVVKINAVAAAASLLAYSTQGMVTGTFITGTLSATAATTDLTETTDSHYIGRVLVFITGTLAGQATPITGYTGASKLLTYTATVTAESPANGDRFVLV